MLETNVIIQDDCIEVMKTLPDNSVDSIVTDPPYGIGFMGKEWDNFDKSYYEDDRYYNKLEKETKTGVKHRKFGSPAQNAGRYDLSPKGMLKFQMWYMEVAKECLRVLKPGGHLLSFGGSRTYHRMACAIEDAGFEIRDQIMWLYGSGFPKSLNIGKQVDKIQGNEREVVGTSKGKGYSSQQEKNKEQGFRPYKKGLPHEHADRTLTKGTSQWEGWGTALKPAHEPIVVARKPLSEKSVALNVLKWGTGGINIDGCRIGTEDITYRKPAECLESKEKGTNFNTCNKTGSVTDDWKGGRFPANIILDEVAGQMLDEQSGMTGALAPVKSGQKGFGGVIYNKYKTGGDDGKTFYDKGKLGGASRFFYCAKASKSERNYGLDNLDEKVVGHNRAEKCGTCGKFTLSTTNPCKCPLDKRKVVWQTAKNNHPTVKPIKLMIYLIRLVTPKGGVVLDPFGGSGTTGIACIKEGMKFILIEKEPDYVKIANARLKPFLEQKTLKEASKCANTQK